MARFDDELSIVSALGATIDADSECILMDLKALTIAGTVILLVAGWAMTAMLNQMENQESDINALGQRTSTVETQIKDHEELPAHNEPK